MIVSHFSEVDWDETRWPNFSASEVSCNHCGEMYYDEAAFDTIQFMRDTVGKGLTINSAHRCAFWNAHEGGKPGSMHKKNAFDVSIVGHDIAEILSAAKAAGFTGYGFYGSFLHVDLGRTRQWHTASGERTWSSLVTF